MPHPSNFLSVHVEEVRIRKYKNLWMPYASIKIYGCHLLCHFLVFSSTKTQRNAKHRRQSTFDSQYLSISCSDLPQTFTKHPHLSIYRWFATSFPSKWLLHYRATYPIIYHAKSIRLLDILDMTKFLSPLAQM